jgi:LL-diaminopimelate aminotransferase
MWTEKLARRLTQLPPYLFAQIDRLKGEVAARGMDVIDLGVGDPDLPTPPHIIARLQEAALDPANHRYPSYSGMGDFKVSVARWYERRFGVSLDPRTEVVSLIGSKEGIAHIPLAFVDPGDVVLVPDPGYPVYQAGTVFAGGEPYRVPLREDKGFLLDPQEVPEDVARRAVMLFINYPNNPTGATADMDYFRKVVAWSRAHGVMVCHDAAYSEMAFDGYRPHSILELPEAREVAIEFHSLSKTYNMTGWRLGFAVGNAEIVAGLGRIKTNVDSGVFQAVQLAGMAALDGPQEPIAQHNRIYQERRDALVEGLRAAGLEVNPPRATFYVWVKVPQGYTSASFTAHLLSKAGIVTTPGNGFGQHGEGFIRMTLTVPVQRLREAVRRIREAGY